MDNDRDQATSLKADSGLEKVDSGLKIDSGCLPPHQHHCCSCPALLRLALLLLLLLLLLVLLLLLHHLLLIPLLLPAPPPFAPATSGAAPAGATAPSAGASAAGAPAECLVQHKGSPHRIQWRRGASQVHTPCTFLNRKSYPLHLPNQEIVSPRTFLIG